MAELQWEDAPNENTKWEDSPAAGPDLGPLPWVKGLGEAALTLGTGAIAQPLSGLAGIAKGGDADTVRSVQEKLTYVPRSKEGKRINEAVSTPFEWLINTAGDVGETVGGNAGRAISQVATEVGLNFIPLKIGTGLKGSKAKGRLGNKLDRLDAELTAPKEIKWEDAPQMELPLENSPQQIAEMRARELGQRDLFAPTNEPLAQNVPNVDFRKPEYTTQDTLPLATDIANSPVNALPREVSPQAELFGAPKDVTPAPYVKPMETARQEPMSLENTAQQVAEMQNRQSGQLDMFAPVNEPTPMRIPQSQRGGVDLEAVRKWFTGSPDGAMTRTRSLPIQAGRANAEQQKAGPGHYMSMSKDIADTYAGKGGTIYSVETPFTKPFDFNKVDPITRKSGETQYKELVQKLGSKTKANQYLESQGYDAITFTDNRGNKIANTFTEQPLVKEGPARMFVPQSQRGAIDLGNATEPKNNPISNLNEKSPEVIRAKEQLRLDKNKSNIANRLGIDGYRDDIDSSVKVIAAAPTANDITPFQLARAKTVTPGINAIAIDTANPLLKYVRSSSRKVFQEAESLTKQYITGKNGIKKELERMTQAEKNEVVLALQKASKARKYLDTALLQKTGFSENQINFVKKFYVMDKAKLDIWNAERAKVGMPPVDELPGHMPGIFNGDYKQIVFGKNQDGSKKVLGVIAVDSTRQLKAAQNKMKEQFPGATFSTPHRASLGGNGRKSDMFSGMNDVIELLAKNDPEFAKVQELINSAVKENADALYAANLHSLKKKGVVGNAGEKPWLNQTQNTNDFIKSYLRYWEEGIISHKNLSAESELKALLNNEALDTMPNAKEYANLYWENMTGRSLGTVGDALNKLIDAPARYTGFGPSVPREAVNQLNKRFGQHTMGWGNWLYSMVQYLQMPQMFYPEALRATQALGMNPAEATARLTAFAKHIPGIIKEVTTGDSNLSPLMKTAVKEAETRGLLNFSEFQDVNQITQSKFSRGYDKVADFNRSLPEMTTRPTAFFMMVDALKDSGMSTKDIYDVAYNATQRAMVDYHPRERPMMYQRLGVVGQLAGSLQTFKHAQLSQLGSLMTRKEGIGGLIAATAVLAAFSGIKGTPFYQEADEVFKYLTNKFGNEQKSIKEAFLQNMPEWLQSGALSTATDVNLQSRLSAADVLPNSIPEAITPFGSTIGNIGGAVAEAITKQDPLSFSNLAVAMSPSGPIKGMVEDAVRTAPDTENTNIPEGTPIDKKGYAGNPRTDWDSIVRKYSGATSLSESLRNEKQWTQITREMGNKAAQKSISENMMRDYRQGILTPEKQKEYIDKYIARKGDPQQLINSLVEEAQKSKMNKQQRLEGIPNNSLGSIYRYENYQR